MPLRVKLAIGAFAGLAVAWIIPKGGPAPVATPTPTPPGQLTAAEVPLNTVPAGVSFRTIDGVRIFLVRTGDSVVGFLGTSTDKPGPIFWCAKNDWFEGLQPGPYYSRGGVAVRVSAPRSLDRINVIVAAGRVTIFPHTVLRGGPAPVTQGPNPPPPTPSPPCSPTERVG
jgi:hypothetical protein